jgi:hypothetical protein
VFPPSTCPLRCSNCIFLKSCPVSADIGLETTKAAGFLVHTAYSYVLLLSGFAILVQRLCGATSLYLHQIAAIWIACMAQWVANLIYLTGLSPFPQRDLPPFHSLSLAWVLHGA